MVRIKKKNIGICFRKKCKKLEGNLNQLNNIWNKFGLKFNFEKIAIQNISRCPDVVYTWKEDIHALSYIGTVLNRTIQNTINERSKIHHGFIIL